MQDEHKQSIFLRLEHCLQHLALPADAQLQLLPDFVCKADELALTFDQWREVVVENYGSELTAKQISSLAAIDEAFAAFPDSNTSWTDEAVRKSEKWLGIRHLAGEALLAFEWQPEMPPSYAHEYIGADGPPSMKKE
jgi:hypothetical protein